MADQYVQVPADSTGKKIDTSELTVNTQTVERQRINISDPTTAAAIAAVENADPGASDYGLVVRTVAGTAAKPLRVDPTGSTAQPITAAALPLPSGASTAAKQPALGTAGSASADVITVQGIASMTALKVDGSAVTQPVSFSPSASGGYLTKHLVAAGSTNATNVKASAGQVFGWSIFNSAAYAIYVKLHNNSGTPTAGTGVVQTIAVQAGMSVTGFNTHGIAFGTGIALTIVKDITDAGATAVVANDCVVDLFYV